jgi:hypothetical protein
MTQKTQYLHELLATLNEDELRSLANLGLKGKEKDLFDLYIRYVGKPAPSKELIGAELSMSSSHIDKTNSIVLKKCYGALTSNGIGLWDIFLLKHLPRHLYHDFSLRERELKRTNDKTALSKFYFDAFETIHQLPYQDSDQAEAGRFMKSYFELTPNVSNGERIMIEGRYIRQLITSATGSSAKVSNFFYLETRLKELENLIDDSVIPLHRTQFFLACAHYYKVIDSNEQKQREYLSQSLELTEKYPNDFVEIDAPLMRAKIADTYFQESNFEKAYSIYCEIIPKWRELMKTQFFYLSTYAHLATLCGKFTDTDSIINEFFGQYLQKEQEGQLRTVAEITLAKRLLSSGDIKKAKVHIDNGFMANDKGLLLPFDLELRKLETLYFALSGDYAFAEDLIAKHIKFLHSKKISVKSSLHGKFFKVMRDIIEERTTGKQLSTVSEALLAELSSSFFAIYGILLSKIRK